MKVEVKENETEKELKFPCLMVRDSEDKYIVLFSKCGCGTVISKSNNHEIGDYYHTWLMSSFKPFNGTITLSND